jgi:metal-responsive CopG/Arc/MetJ family transcriptional regulator
MAVRTNLLLPEALLEEVDRFAGPRGRSRFVAEALEAKLKRERLREAIRATAGILKAEDYPYWRTSEDVVEWVRAGRAEKTRVSDDLAIGPADGGPDAADA